MSKIRDIILAVLNESAKKVEFILSNPKLVNGLIQAIQRDIEVEDKSLTPEALLNSWDNDIYLNKNLSWVVRQYINDAFHYGDIYKVKEDLEKFEKYKKNKDIFDSADLNQYDYSTLKQKLNNIDDNNINQLGSSARKNAIEKGKDKIEKVYEDTDWIILIPKTQAAAMYYGKNTRWCTAADGENNMFNHYNNKYGPLFIAINKNNPNEKYQACFEAGEYKDKDNNGGTIPKNTKAYEFLKNEAKSRNAIKKWWWWFDANEITDEMMLNALKNVKIQYGNIDWESSGIGYAIKSIFRDSNRSMSEDFIKKAVAINPKFIQEVDNPSPEVQILFLDWVWNSYIKNTPRRYFNEHDLKVITNDYLNNELSDKAKAFIKKVETEEQESGGHESEI